MPQRAQWEAHAALRVHPVTHQRDRASDEPAPDGPRARRRARANETGTSAPTDRRGGGREGPPHADPRAGTAHCMPGSGADHGSSRQGPAKAPTEREK